MLNLDDFNLDIRKAAINENGDSRAVPSIGAICTLISGVIIGSVVTGCSDQCVTSDCTLYCPKTTYCTTGQD